MSNFIKKISVGVLKLGVGLVCKTYIVSARDTFTGIFNSYIYYVLNKHIILIKIL